MAIYSYKCRECESIQEEKHSVSENPEIECKECGSTHTFRYLGNGNVRVLFRGLGWAINDSALDRMKVPERVRLANKNTMMRD